MKRLLSLLVVIAMMVSMIPNVFATKEDVDFDELTGRLVVLEDISSFEVNLAEGSDGMIYQWTPDANYNLSLSYTAPEGADITVTVTQGETTVVAENGAAALPVWADELVEIEVVEAAAQAATFTVTGETASVPGSDEWNGIFLGNTENAVTAEGTVFSGNTTWYQGYFSGTVMTVTGTGAYNVIYNGETIAAVDGVVSTAVASSNPRMPVVFAIDAVGEYTISFAYPAGSASNPAQLVIGDNTASIEAGNDQGYYYTWTAEEDGTLVITMPSNIGWTYVINNMTAGTYGDTQWSDSDPVVNPAEIEVSAGDELQIIVNTYDPADMWSNPAADLVVNAAFESAASATAITITKQPVSVITDENANFTLTVEAEGEGLTYQWARIEPNGTTWQNFNSAKAATYSAVAYKSSHGRQYKCIITDANGNSVETEPVTLSVRYIVKQPSAGYMSTYGEKVNFSVEYSRPATYQWQLKYSTEADTAWRTTSAQGNKTNTLTFSTTNKNNQYQFRCVITDADGTVMISNPANLWVRAAAPVVNSAPSGQFDVVNSYYAFLTVEAEGEGVAYQWYCLEAGATDWDTEGYPCASSVSAKEQTFRFIGYRYRQGYQYRCKVTTPNGSTWNEVWTDPVIVNIVPGVDIIEQPMTAEVVKGESATFSVQVQMPNVEIVQDGTYQKGDGSTITYKWQKSKTGVNYSWVSGEDFSGYETDTLTVIDTEQWAGYYFRCIITNDCQQGQGDVFSEGAQLLVTE